MEFIIGLLRFVLFLDCALLVLLVLIQLPKKEAGLGVAFGGAATDALFGAGAGNAITRITKWCAVIFFVLSLGIAVADSRISKANREATEKHLLSEAAHSADTAKAATLDATKLGTTNAPAAPAAAATETNVAPAEVPEATTTAPATPVAPATPATAEPAPAQ